MKKNLLVILSIFIMVSLSSAVFAQTDSEYNKAMKYYNTGKYKEAVSSLKEYAKKNPSPAVYYRIGYALYKLKNFEEANEYFKEAYLINPDFSPWEAGLVKEEIEAAKPSVKQVLPEKETPAPVAKPEVKKELAPAVKPSAPEPQKTGTQKAEPPAPAPMPAPALPKPGKPMPKVAPGLIAGLIAGFAMIMLIASLAVYIYFSLCLFLIAKKLNVPAPWTAWIPIVQVWAFVASAGKPWWWILLLLVPIANFFVGIYLWMCITENLGRSKWLGLLILLPVVNLVFVGILAFSKREKTGGMEVTSVAE